MSGACSKEEPGPSRRICGYVLTGKYLTNIQLHPTVYDDIQRETIKKQLTIEEVAAMVTHYHHSIHVYATDNS